MRKGNQEYPWIVCHYTKNMACEPLQMREKYLSSIPVRLSMRHADYYVRAISFYRK
jgi:hypothetical protein